MKASPKLRIIRRVLDNGKVWYVPQIKGYVWYNIQSEQSFYGDVLRKGSTTYEQDVIALFRKYELYFHKGDSYIMFNQSNFARDFVDEAYELFVAAYPAYVKWVKDENIRLNNLPKDKVEIYRRPPKWKLLKDIFG